MLNNESHNDFCPDSIPLTFVPGEVDNNEWLIGNSGYEVTLTADSYPIEHDVYAKIERIASKRGYSTVGWSVKMYMHGKYKGTNEKEVLRVKVKTLKSAKEAIYGRLQEMQP